MAHSPLATPSATVAALKRHGLYTKKSLGQHFLVDDNVVGRILQLADVIPGATIVEVGPGIGTLTAALCGSGASVVAVERDAALVPALAEATAGFPGFALIHADAVQVTAEQLSAPFGPPTALVANLPYHVAATVVLRFFEILPALAHATVMVQSEVADRMAARPGTKAYGSYTVKLRLYAEPAGRFPVAAGCFLPPPRVESAVIRLQRRANAVEPALLAHASQLADAAFAQRRKTIRNSMRSSAQIAADDLDAAFLASGIDGDARAETLAPESFVALALQLGQET